ncbi:uncharacterized protein FIBRA_02327 [Fibroporia radiculosa]|uniref:Uncharacterized protein n=1 Tax=Fibroporia radiculosa TaxID=599839 RepID=J4HUR2_9APHY|nr:uncharacterized protein FIBRA_02327 [Fibroporia radiculosa]CCM00297.1 predicted protein [Fibroporia radiculosa]
MESASPNCSSLPNAFNELSYLTPSLAPEFQLGRYILAGSLGAMTWELLSNLSNDYRLLFKHRLGFPTLVYYISRLSTFTYALVSVVLQTASVGHCQAIQYIDTIFMALSVSTTSLLFYFRMSAVYHSNKYMMGAYTIVWLGVVAGSMMLIPSATGGAIGPTNFCITKAMEMYAGAIGVSVLLHDTFVFIAISWRLVLNSYHEVSDWRRVRAFLYGESLQPISKTLLRDGQLYYAYVLNP